MTNGGGQERPDLSTAILDSRTKNSVFVRDRVGSHDMPSYHVG